MAPLTEADIEIIEKQLQKGKWAQDLVKELLVEGRGSRTAIYRKIQRWEKTGTAAPAPKRIGRPPAVTIEENEWLLERLHQSPELTMHDLQALLLTERNVHRSISAVSRAMKRSGGNPKYKRNPKKKAVFRAVPAVDPQLSEQRQELLEEAV